MRVLLLALSTLLATISHATENPFDTDAFKKVLKEYQTSFENGFVDIKGASQPKTGPRNPAAGIDWQFDSKKPLPDAVNSCVVMLKLKGEYVHMARNFFPVSSVADGEVKMKHLENVILKSLSGDYSRTNLPTTYFRADPKYLYYLTPLQSVSPIRINGRDDYYDLFLYTFMNETFLCLDLVSFRTSPVMTIADLEKDLTAIFNGAKGGNSIKTFTIAGVPMTSGRTSGPGNHFEFLIELFDNHEEAAKFFLKMLASLKATTGIEGKKETGSESSEWAVRYTFAYKEKRERVTFEVEMPKKCANKDHGHAIQMLVY